MFAEGAEYEDNSTACVVWPPTKIVVDSGCSLMGSGVNTSTDKCPLTGGGSGGGLLNVVMASAVPNYSR